jgi:hypothetical protein
MVWIAELPTGVRLRLCHGFVRGGLAVFCGEDRALLRSNLSVRAVPVHAGVGGVRHPLVPSCGIEDKAINLGGLGAGPLPLVRRRRCCSVDTYVTLRFVFRYVTFLSSAAEAVTFAVGFNEVHAVREPI